MICYEFWRAWLFFADGVAAGLKFSNRNLESFSSTTNKAKQPMFTAQSKPVVRENNGVNQSIVVVAGSTTQPIASTNPCARLIGNKCYRCGKLGHWFSTCPKRAAVNLVVAEEGKTKGEQEGEEVYNDADGLWSQWGLRGRGRHAIREIFSDSEVVAHTEGGIRWSAEWDLPGTMHY